jgi:hypothetical protein
MSFWIKNLYRKLNRKAVNGILNVILRHIKQLFIVILNVQKNANYQVWKMSFEMRLYLHLTSLCWKSNFVTKKDYIIFLINFLLYKLYIILLSNSVNCILNWYKKSKKTERQRRKRQRDRRERDRETEEKETEEKEIEEKETK